LTDIKEKGSGNNVCYSFCDYLGFHNPFEFSCFASMFFS
jgi:hypothetical protein